MRATFPCLTGEKSNSESEQANAHKPGPDRGSAIAVGVAEGGRGQGD